MKLNLDCVRDTMLALEDLTGYYPDTNHLKDITAQDVNEVLPQYEYHDILYTLFQLHSAGYIKGNKISCLGGTDILVNDITWIGHEFIRNTSSNDVWHATLDKVKSAVGSASIGIIADVAANIAKARLGLL